MSKSIHPKITQMPQVNTSSYLCFNVLRIGEWRHQDGAGRRRLVASQMVVATAVATPACILGFEVHAGDD
jgi:hypothetical protein